MSREIAERAFSNEIITPGVTTPEDDAIVTERGVEWFYPVNQRILLIK